MRIYLSLCMLMIVPTLSYGQKGGEVYETEPYEVRIKKVYINGVYIPENLDDAIRELDSKMSQEALAAFRKYSEEEAERKAFFSFGRWMMVNWGLEEGSRLSHYFRQEGVGVVEDMVRVLMVSYHRHLNDKPLDSETLMNIYKKKRQDEQKQKEKEREALIESLRKGGGQ